MSTNSNLVTTSAIGTANGVAGLDAGGRVPQAQIPTPKITVGTTAPTSPSLGDVWIDTN
ncbi:hypothetical protein [Actinacidiphila sp. ITFR-21]|uniref:hypothetical protein n=1 Tax=Actinacidiphila sp. ITFR-21 TaxID=3075199 RepID=UPI00288B7494|nr:hypothetical protein [Streptomyces sp. ITFR-21]WNI17624.1 hypothetical protein RLT57_20255 [Streptomyces sp. ITFR-21]WNI17764.1 hypothetical protein RLT57_20970 [Streptomyces sp. ITFR-21]